MAGGASRRRLDSRATEGNGYIPACLYARRSLETDCESSIYLTTISRHEAYGNDAFVTLLIAVLRIQHGLIIGGLLCV